MSRRGERFVAEKSLRETDLGNNVWSDLMSDTYSLDAPSIARSSPPHETVSTSALSVLVVEPHLEELIATVAALTHAGFHVTAADSFAQAKPLLGTNAPAVLLTSLRLGGFNGLHLVVRGKSLQPKLAAVVTSLGADAMLQADAEALGATFIVKPITTDQLVASILKTYFKRNGDDEPVRPPFERRVAERRALQPVDAISAERRGPDRRRPLPWLLPPGPHTS